MLGWAVRVLCLHRLREPDDQDSIGEEKFEREPNAPGAFTKLEACMGWVLPQVLAPIGAWLSIVVNCCHWLTLATLISRASRAILAPLPSASLVLLPWSA